MKTNLLDRRTFLRSTGVAVALPALDAMNATAAEQPRSPQRSVFICTSLGLHTPALYADEGAKNYLETPYLQLLKDHHKRFTLFSGLSHPDQQGKDGHSSQMTWLTAAPEPGLGGFRNSLSVDQQLVEKFGYVTRFPSLILSTAGQTSQSYTRSGVMLPAEHRPSRVFAKMFLEGKPHEIKEQRRRLKDGRSILDTLTNQSKRLNRRVSRTDQKRLEEYFDSIRQTEIRFSKAEQWMDTPKPKVDAAQPEDVKDESDLIGRTQLLFDLIPLAVQTDSTRVVSVLINGRNDVPPVDGVSIDHHNLSHHGQDTTKIEQLKRIESAIVTAFGKLLKNLTEKEEAAGPLLNNTMVLFGSNLGNANSHDWRNLPIVFAGGNYAHGQHVAYDKDDNTPLCNLFVTMLQQMGVEADKFASSTGTLTWS